MDEAEIENPLGRDRLRRFGPLGGVSDHLLLKLLVHGSRQKVSMYRSLIHAFRQPLALPPKIQMGAIDKFGAKLPVVLY